MPNLKHFKSIIQNVLKVTHWGSVPSSLWTSELTQTTCARLSNRATPKGHPAQVKSLATQATPREKIPGSRRRLSERVHWFRLLQDFHGKSAVKRGGRWRGRGWKKGGDGPGGGSFVCPNQWNRQRRHPSSFSANKVRSSTNRIDRGGAACVCWFGEIRFPFGVFP